MVENNDSIKLGNIGLLKGDSLDQSIKSISRIMDSIKNANGISTDYFQHMFLFSSRGSYPFLRGLDAYHSRVGEEATLALIPHIYGIVNLFEITGGHIDIKKKVYEQISQGLREKIIRTQSRGTERIISDWDEVNKGANLEQRLDIYSLLNLPPDLPLNIVSFISVCGHNLCKEHKGAIRRKKRNLSKNNDSTTKFFDCGLSNLVEWSDNEDFYSEMGISYPGIAAPNRDYIKATVAKNFVPEFYVKFFRNYHTILSENRSDLPSNLQYKLVRVTPEQRNYLYDEQVIIDTSHEALMRSLYEIEKEGGIKSNRNMHKIENGSKNYTRGVVSINGSKKERNILSRGCIDSDIGTYRSPFLMIYEQGSPGSLLFDKALFEYFSTLGNHDLKNRFSTNKNIL